MLGEGNPNRSGVFISYTCFGLYDSDLPIDPDVEKAKQALAEAQAERETARKAAVPTAPSGADRRLSR